LTFGTYVSGERSISFAALCHGVASPISCSQKCHPISLVPKAETLLLMLRCVAAARKRVVCPTIQLVMNPP
jgi:hypothetical protein